jgi:hypothetical protein
MGHPALVPGRAAIVTGAASGIGLAACKQFASLGMKVCLADETPLDGAKDAVASLAANGLDDVMALHTDVSKLTEMSVLRNEVQQKFGNIGILMNNAVTRLENTTWSAHDNWLRTFDVNLMGVVNGVQAFAPAMTAQAHPSLIVNTGSKQGITNPPKNPAYNAAKAAVKSYTESLQHELRNMDACKLTAHLLVPGWTTTGTAEHKQGAWLPSQVVDYMIAALDRGDFYIICPDDEVTTDMDRARILWAAGDIVENRPPLSRWHSDYADEFKE